MYLASDHTFVLCAYKESPYLAECLDSLRNQRVQSTVLVATATPNEYIEKLCRDYDVPLYVNPDDPGIATDWNFAISCAETPLVTIAHQDDVYESRYTMRMLESVNSSKHPLLFFSNYGELRAHGVVDKNSLLSMKRLMLTPLRCPPLQASRFVRRRVLSFGSPICCPSVTIVTSNVPMPLFSSSLKCDLDWQAWERVSRLEGSFLYDPNILMHHRIHEDSETTALIQDNTRTREDMLMFELFWPRPIARLLGRIYASSQKSNE